MNTAQVAEFELAAVIVAVEPDMLQAAAIGVVPCTCARQCVRAGVEGCALNVTVHVVPELIVQAPPLASQCCVLVQSCSESRCASGCKLPPDQFFMVATVPFITMPGLPAVKLVSVMLNVPTPLR